MGSRRAISEWCKIVNTGASDMLTPEQARETVEALDGALHDLRTVAVADAMCRVLGVTPGTEANVRIDLPTLEALAEAALATMAEQDRGH